MQIQIQIEILYQKISQIEIQIHKKKVFENTFQIQILFKYTSLLDLSAASCFFIFFQGARNEEINRPIQKRFLTIIFKKVIRLQSS